MNAAHQQPIDLPLSRDCQPIPTFFSLIEYCYDDVVVVVDDDGNDHGVLNTSKQC